MFCNKSGLNNPNFDLTSALRLPDKTLIEDVKTHAYILACRSFKVNPSERNFVEFIKIKLDKTLISFLKK